MTPYEKLTAAVHARPDLRRAMELGRKKARIMRYCYQIWERRTVNQNARLIVDLVTAWMNKTDWTMDTADQVLDMLTPAYIRIVIEGPSPFTPADVDEKKAFRGYYPDGEPVGQEVA